MGEDIEEFLYYTGLLILGMLVGLILVLSVARVAEAHDVFRQERMLNRQTLQPTGPSCCGGEPDTGDCEHLAPEQIKIHNDGSMTIYSKRYNAWVEVARDIIQTKRITGAPEWAAGAWCGVHYSVQIDQLQADPNFNTYCAMLSPGDV